MEWTDIVKFLLLSYLGSSFSNQSKKRSTTLVFSSVSQKQMLQVNDSSKLLNPIWKPGG
jgi:hypothetical protein